MAEPAVSLRDVSKKFRLYRERAGTMKSFFVQRNRSRYQELWAVREVSLDVPRGSTFGFIGHNGSGKSTLLKLIAGVHPPTTGTVSAHGRVSSLIELGAGFHPDLTGRENVYLNGAILGLTRKEINTVFDDIVAFSELQDFIDSPVKIYSSGMYVRLGFSVAVNLEPDILLVDEVIAVGDEDFQRRCYEHIEGLRRRGTTIVVVSHDMATVKKLCDRVAWVEGGRVLEEGDPADVVRAYVGKVEADEEVRRGASPAEAVPAEGPEGSAASLSS